MLIKHPQGQKPLFLFRGYGTPEGVPLTRQLLEDDLDDC